MCFTLLTTVLSSRYSSHRGESASWPTFTRTMDPQNDALGGRMKIVISVLLASLVLFGCGTSEEKISGLQSGVAHTAQSSVRCTPADDDRDDDDRRDGDDGERDHEKHHH